MLRINDEAEANTELILVDNFVEELRQRVGELKAPIPWAVVPVDCPVD